MAEYVASILALVATGLSTARITRELIHAIRDAPDELLALANEVESTSLVLQRAQVAFDAVKTSQLTLGLVDSLISRTITIFTQLDDFLLRLKDVNGPKFRLWKRLTWAREKENAQKLLTRLRNVRAEIDSLLQAENVYD